MNAKWGVLLLVGGALCGMVFELGWVDCNPWTLGLAGGLTMVCGISFLRGWKGWLLRTFIMSLERAEKKRAEKKAS